MNGLRFNVERAGSLRPLVGNYVIIESDVGFVFLAHAQTGSIRTRKAIGSAWTSFSPGSAILATRRPLICTSTSWTGRSFSMPGILCAFREYEVLKQGKWHQVRDGIPRTRTGFAGCDA